MALLQLNPTVNDPFPTKSLSQLRSSVFDALGFTNLQTYANTDVGYRSMGELTTSVRTALGLAAPLPTLPDTLLNIRNNLYNMLGMGAMSIHPPGVDTMLTSFINTAQQIIYRALEVDAAGIIQGLGPETVTNGSFNGSATGWTLGSEWAYSANSIVNTNTGAHTIASQPINVVAGQTYIVTYQQTQSVAYNPATNTGGQGVICQIGSASDTLGTQNAFPTLVQQITPARVSITITATATGTVTLSFQNATGSPNLTGWTPSGTVAITNISCKPVQASLATQAPPMLISGTNDSTLTLLDSIAITNLATGLAKQYYGQADASEYFQWYGKWLKDLEGRGPPNITNIIINALQDAQREIARTYEVQYQIGGLVQLNAFAVPSDVPTLDNYAIYKLAVANLKTLMKLPNAEMAMKEYEKYLSDLAKRCPPEAPTLINRLLKQAQDFLFRTYSVFRMERWFTWTLQAGQRFYGVDSDDSSILSAPTNVSLSLGAAGSYGNMNDARAFFRGHVLQDSTMLVMGGLSATQPNTLATAEIYDPATGLFTYTGNMISSREAFTSSLLPSGQVFVAGGIVGQAVTIGNCELYNPITKVWTATGALNTPRFDHTATLLNNGKVLLVGGYSGLTGAPLATAEIYDPTTGLCSFTGPMATNVTQHTATLLPNGQVLVTGGRTGGGTTMATASYLYDPIAAVFTATGSLAAPRYNHTATLMNTGVVLVVGGKNLSSLLTSCELFTFNSASFSTSAAALANARQQHTATLIKTTGKVLIAGGDSATAELYDPIADSFAAPVNLVYAHVMGHTSLLNNGLILLAGGSSPSVATNNVEFYNSTANTFTKAGSLTQGTPFYRVAASDPTGITIPSLPEVSITGVPASSAVIIVWTPPVVSRGDVIVSYSIYGRTSGAEQLIATVPGTVNTYTDLGTIIPNGAMPTGNTTANINGALDPREITWVGASCNQNTWRRLIEGVPPQIYNAAVSGPPQYYEIRQAIEIWPSPPDSTWQLQIKGYFSPLPFEVDTDTCWIDWQAIYLYATAKAKAHYRQTDARDYERDCLNYVKQLVAGTHKTARYIPGQTIRPIRPLPVAVPPFS